MKLSPRRLSIFYFAKFLTTLIPSETVTFRAGIDEQPKDIQKRIKALFERVKDAAYGDVFDSSDTIKLDANSLAYVVGELQNYCIMDASKFQRAIKVASLP